MIIEDEEDILYLYRDYISRLGHDVVSCFFNADNIMNSFEKNEPDICLIDYILRGKINGIDAAVKILDKCPLMPILFITAYKSLSSELSKHPKLRDKNIEVLVKPVRLLEIENTMLRVVNKGQ